MARVVAFVFVALISLAKCTVRAADETNSNWSVWPSFVSKIYNDCERKDYELMDCLKVKVISFLDRVSRSDVIELDDAVTLVREGGREEHGRALSENDIEHTVAGDKGAGQLNQMIFDRLAKFLNSHSLKIGFPKVDVTSFAKNLEEGRGKMKKTMGMFMMAAMMKAMMMIPLSIGTLFILAGKALIISKIALVLSLLITIKKLLSKPTEHVVHESHGGWNPSASTGGWDRRSYRQPETGYNQNMAQNLAYNSYTVQ